VDEDFLWGSVLTDSGWWFV